MRDMAFLRDSDGGDRLQRRFSSLAPTAQSTVPLDAYRCQGPYGLNFLAKSPGGGRASRATCMLYSEGGDVLLDRSHLWRRDAGALGLCEAVLLGERVLLRGPHSDAVIFFL